MVVAIAIGAGAVLICTCAFVLKSRRGKRG